MPGQIWSRIVSVLSASLCCTLVSLSAHAQIAPIRLDLPAQPLAQALTTLGSLANLNIYFDAPIVDGIEAPALKAELSPDDALSRLLAGTRLRAVRVDENTFRVVTVTDSKHAQSPTHSTDTGAVHPPNTVHLASAGVDAKADGGAEYPDAPSGSASTSGNLAEVVVTGRYEFLSADTSGTTNLPLPIEKVPQFISLVSNDFVKAADLKTLGAIAEYTPGALNVGNPENFGFALYLRGFPAFRAVDGVNVQDFNSYEPDYAIFDRLEIVQGPASVVYGVSSPGGLVNFVTKSATRDTPDYLYAQAGSWNSFRLEGQVAGALDPDGHVRAIGLAIRDQGDSFINDLKHQKTSLYGGVNVDFTDSVTGYLHGGYEKLERPSFDGIPPQPDGSPAPVPRSFFIGSPDIQFTTSVYHAEGDLTWHATPMLDVSLKGNFERSNSWGAQEYAYGLDTFGNIGLAALELPMLLVQNYGIGLSSIYRFDELGLKNSFVSLSALYQGEHRESFQLNSNSGTANIFDGEQAISQAFNSLLTGPLSPFAYEENTHTLTVSLQSVLQVVGPLSVLLGASHSQPDVTVVATGTPGTQNYSIPGQTSYRAGLTYEFLPRTNAYLSFSQSFAPTIGEFGVGFSVLPPLEGNEYEGGVKYRSSNGRLLLNGAVFQINERNVAEFDTVIDGNEFFSAVGEVRHRGVELQALGQITHPWQINAGYTYLDPKVTADADPTAIGQTQLFLPKQTASVYSTYTFDDGFARGLSFGVGTRYVGSQRTAYDGSTKDIPGYTLVDANIGYTIDKWLLQLNGHNILDRHYFINNYQTLFYGNTVGDPANLSVSIRYRF